MSSRQPTEILIRHARPDDYPALMRLAILDSATEPPRAPLLIAEFDGELAVALSEADGTVIADPFRPTAETVALLRYRAARAHPSGWSRRLNEFRRLLQAPTRSHDRARQPLRP
jgi:hypothetical protein